MNPKKHLFQLISCLTKAEKRGFSMYLKRYNPQIVSNAEMLFEALSKLDEYDEKSFKASLPKNIQKNFSYEKGKLLQNLLSFLAHFNRNSNIEIELQNLLIQIDILMKKKQVSLARKLINRGIDLSKENKDVFFLSRFQVKLMTFYDFADFTVEERKHFFKEFEQTGEEIEKEIKYRAFRERMVLELLFGNWGYHINAEIDPEIVEIWEHDLVRNEEKAITANSKKSLYEIQIFYYRGIGAFEKQLVPQRRIVSLLLNDKRSSILATLANHYNYILTLNRTEHFQEAKKELLVFSQYREKYPEKFDAFGRQMFPFFKTMASLSCSFFWFDFSETEKIIKENDAYVETNFSRFDFRRIEYFSFLIRYYFVINNWEKTLDYLARYESELNVNERIKILYFVVKAIGVIAHFEQGSDKIVLNSQFVSLYNFARKNDFIGKLFYKEVLAFMRKLSNKPSEEDLKRNTEKFLKALNQIPKYFYPGHEILLLWAESQISNKSMLELSKEKNKEIFPEN